MGTSKRLQSWASKVLLLYKKKRYSYCKILLHIQIIDARNFHLLCQLLDVDFTKSKGRNLKNKKSEFTS